VFLSCDSDAGKQQKIKWKSSYQVFRAKILQTKASRWMQEDKETRRELLEDDVRRTQGD
jgi:hypothetical protein